jgi:hypothetical protein
MRAEAKRACAALCALLGSLWWGGCQELICLADPDEEHLCEAPGELVDESLALSGPVAWSGGAAWRSGTTSRVTLLRTSNASGEVEHVEVPEAPVLLQATPDRERLLVLSAKARTLRVLEPNNQNNHQDYLLGSPFNALSVSEDGAFGIAYYSQSGSSGQVVNNNNEIAVIDLGSPPGASNPQRLSLRSFGSRPSGVIFAPPFTLRGQERRVAMILASNYVTLLELDGFDPENPNRNERVVQFTRDDLGAALRVRQVVWTDDDPNDDADFFAFLLTDGSDDIISLNLLPGEELDAEGRPRIQPSLNQLTGGRRPVDIDLFKTKDGKRKLLAVNQTSRDLAVIDVATSDTVLVPLEDAVTSVEVYEAINEDTEAQEPYALLYSTDGVLRSLLFVELETVEVRRTRAITRRNLERGVVGLQMTPDAEDLPRALLLHAGLSTFSILNLEGRFVTTLDVSSSVSSFAFVDEGELVTSLQGLPWVSFVELATGYPVPVRLDEPAESVTVIPETNTVLVDHGRSLGVVTLLPIDDKRREAARRLIGFGAEDLLNLDSDR